MRVYVYTYRCIHKSIFFNLLKALHKLFYFIVLNQFRGLITKKIEPPISYSFKKKKSLTMKFYFEIN